MRQKLCPWNKRNTRGTQLSQFSAGYSRFVPLFHVFHGENHFFKKTLRACARNSGTNGTSPAPRPLPKHPRSEVRGPRSIPHHPLNRPQMPLAARSPTPVGTGRHPTPNSPPDAPQHPLRANPNFPLFRAHFLFRFLFHLFHLFHGPRPHPRGVGVFDRNRSANALRWGCRSSSSWS